MQYSFASKDDEQNENKEKGSAMQPDLHAEEDGRNKEWEDRARVNKEKVPEGTQTNLERDFEPEQKAPKPPDHPAY